MDTCTRHTLDRLLEDRDGPCVSLFMPTHRREPGTEQDPIRLKNLVRRAQADMDEMWLDGAAAKDLLEPARALVDQKDFWANASDGLAVFLAPGFREILRLPAPFEEACIVGPRFRVTPLLPLVDTSDHHLVLALSQNEVRLLRCHRFGCELVPTPQAPVNMEEALRYDNPEESLQLHSGSSGSAGSMRAAVFHGQGTVEAVEKTNLLRYFRRVDKGIHAALRGDTSPLLLACVDYYAPLYEEANTYPGLARERLSGNPETFTNEQLLTRSRDALAGRRRASLEDARRRFAGLAGTGKTGTRLSEVLTACREGRVDTLFVALDEHVWGYLEPDATVRRLAGNEQTPGAEDLLDRVVTEALRTRATVRVVPHEEVPTDGPLAAIYRY
jgi:hypothetical protein